MIFSHIFSGLPPTSCREWPQSAIRAKMCLVQHSGHFSFPVNDTNDPFNSMLRCAFSPEPSKAAIDERKYSERRADC